MIAIAGFYVSLQSLSYTNLLTIAWLCGISFWTVGEIVTGNGSWRPNQSHNGFARITINNCGVHYNKKSNGFNSFENLFKFTLSLKNVEYPKLS